MAGAKFDSSEVDTTGAKPEFFQLTESERRIWEAAYAAAWIAEFRETFDLIATSGRPKLRGEILAEALKESYAEEAEMLANQAVRDLRQRCQGLEAGAPTRIRVVAG